MRRPNIMKLVSVVMVVAMLMLSATSAFATTVTIGEDKMTVTVVGKADSYPTTDIAITLLKPGVTEADVNAWLEGANPEWDTSKFLDAASVLVDSENGSYKHTFKLGEAIGSGVYTAYVGDEVIKFALDEDKLVIFKSIVNETNPAALVAKLDEYGTLIGASDELWNAGGDKDVAAGAIIEDLEELRDKGDDLSLEDMDEAKKAVEEEAFTQNFVAGLVDEFDAAADYIDINNALEIYESSDVTDEAKTDAVNDILAGVYESAEDLEAAYNGRMFVAAVTNPKDDLVSYTRKYLDSMGLSIEGLTSIVAYNALGDTQKQAVATALKDSNATTVEGLNADLAAALAPYTVVLPGAGDTTTGGTTGGGGGGGGGSTVVFTTPTPTPAEKPINEVYTDIDHVEWAWDAIEGLTDNSVLSGYGNGIFAPDNAMLREEFVKTLVVGLYGEAAIDMTAVPSFTDAQAGWYAPYIAAAEAYGITSGIGDGLFGVGQIMQRQDMALMLYRILRDSGLEMITTPYEFKDADAIADYAAEAVYALKNTSIMNGDPDGSVRPADSTTRAEASVLVYKVLDMLGKIIH